VRPNIDIGREEWVGRYLKEHPLDDPEHAQEAWEEKEAELAEDAEDVLADSCDPDPDFALDDETPEWELGLPPPADTPAVAATPAEEPEPEEAEAPEDDDLKAWNRLLMKEQGPALGVGGTRGPAPNAPLDGVVNWESEGEGKPPPYAVEAEIVGGGVLHPQSPVTYYEERARDDFDSKRSMPYRLTTEDGTQEWRNIGGAQGPIREVLSASRPLDEWQVALRRGRRNAEATAIRDELALLIARLVDVQGAQATAIAKVLDRGRDAVYALLREGRAKSDT
jgi:hypothetical protein